MPKHTHKGVRMVMTATVIPAAQSIDGVARTIWRCPRCRVVLVVKGS